MIHKKRRLKRLILRLFYRRLWIQIAAVLLAIVAISLFCLGFLLISTSQKAVSSAVLNSHRKIVIRAAEAIELFLKGPEDLLTAAAAMLGVTHTDAWGQETILVELVLNHPIFIRVSSIDLAGKEIATSELGKELNWDYPKVAFREAKTENTYISEIKFLNNHTPYVIMAVPIKRLGEVQGVLVGSVNLRGMWDIVDNIKLADTGRAFLVSSQGVLIAHQDKKRVLKNENLRNQSDVQAALSGRIGAMEIKDELNGKWISSYAPIPGKRWGLILKQDQDEAYRFSKVMKMQSYSIILLSGLIALLVSIFMAQVLLKPIRALVIQTRRVAGGDLGHRIGVRRRDEIGELIRAFNDMTEKLKKAKVRERLSIIGEASARIAHEFKNSLVPIKSFVQLFPRKHKDEVFVSRFSKLVPEEVARWERMIKELSDFSSSTELKTTKINLNQLLRNILELMKDQFVERSINVKFNIQNGGTDLIADPERLKQVFMNLIINAMGAMPQGGTLSIGVDLIHCDKKERFPCIEVRIRDEGKGMSSEETEKIFEPFHTTKRGGMGLGLAVTRKIIEQHDGDIRVESKVDIGTTFVIKLPIKAVGQRPKPSTSLIE